MTVICESASNFKSTLELSKTFSGHSKNNIYGSSLNCDRDVNEVLANDNRNERWQQQQDQEDETRSAKVLRIVWHTLYSKYDLLRRRTQFLKNTICPDNNKKLMKKFRHSMRLNKSAKKKGYEYFMSDEDKR